MTSRGASSKFLQYESCARCLTLHFIRDRILYMDSLSEDEVSTSLKTPVAGSLTLELKVRPVLLQAPSVSLRLLGIICLWIYQVSFLWLQSTCHLIFLNLKCFILGLFQMQKETKNKQNTQRQYRKFSCTKYQFHRSLVLCNNVVYVLQLMN